MYNRRRYGRRRRRIKGSVRRAPSVNFTPVILMLCISVGCGYAAAKYVVEPVVNYVPEIIETAAQLDGKQDSSSGKEESVIEDEADFITEDVAGYALQFGCYSAKAPAEAAMKHIKQENLQILEQNNVFKIIGKIYKTKDEAKKALSNLKPGTEAFVTEVYK